MIPAAFDYIRAGSLAEAIDLLQQDAEGTKLVAGGHTLIPTLKLRLAGADSAAAHMRQAAKRSPSRIS